MGYFGHSGWRGAVKLRPKAEAGPFQQRRPMSKNGSDRRFAFNMLRDDRRGLLARIVLSGVALWLVAMVHSLLEYGLLTLGGSVRLFGYALAIAAAIWVPVHMGRGPRS